VLAAIVAQHGGAPTTVSGAREALAAVTSRRPDVLVCDVAMSGDDGVALIRELRSRSASEGGTTPALAVSADVQAGDAETLLAAGFQSHLAKPVEPAELVRAIARLAGASSSRSQLR
jgi:CheY-like chemotaxis protein